MIDQLRPLAIFAKTIECGSFRGASRVLELSPSVVSHHISQLEEHLGVALIYRSTRKLTLTLEGEKLLIATQNMLSAVEADFLSISSSAKEPSGKLRVTFPAVLSDSPQVTDAIAAFVVRYPRIVLHLDFSDTRKELIDDGFDLAVRMLQNPKETENSRTLFSVNRRLVASSSYLSGRPEIQAPTQLSDMDWVLLSPIQDKGIGFTKTNHKTVNILPVARACTNDARSLFQLVQAGMGIAVLPEFLSQQAVAAGAMQYLLPGWEPNGLFVFAEWPSNAPPHGLAHLFIDALSSSLKTEKNNDLK